MRSGDILLFRTLATWRHPFAWLVRVVTKSRYHHVGIVVVLDGLPFVFEAVRHGTVIRPMERMLRLSRSEIDLYRLDISAESRQSVVRNALVLLGIPYGYFDLIRQFVAIVRGGEAAGTLAAMVCSEAVAAVLETAWPLENKNVVPGAFEQIGRFVGTL